MPERIDKFGYPIQLLSSLIPADQQDFYEQLQGFPGEALGLIRVVDDAHNLTRAIIQSLLTNAIFTSDAAIKVTIHTFLQTIYEKHIDTQTSQIKGEVEALLTQYVSRTPGHFRRFNEDYFQCGNLDKKARYDHTIKALAECLRLDFAEKNTTSYPEEFKNYLDYLADHGISCRIIGHVNSDNKLLDRYDVGCGNAPMIEIYKHHDYFTPLLRESKHRMILYTGRDALEDQLRYMKKLSLRFALEGQAIEDEAISNLCKNINGYIHKLFNYNSITLEQFKKQCLFEVEQSRSVLERLGWKQILANVVLAILGVGVLYGVGLLINKACTGSFLFFSNHKMHHDLNQITDRIHAIEYC